ncbi:hypothetical protein SAICODRAFT_28406 [Saitoella complicata NRRL Y-17804]|uniref:uncharacterized protein n=1 Tax=Saitoella complicata (strain BCRC 22490 / CBS 7301 / JCM 7358 / NBRC 10748 / NRRL Y-17804) TaxID=698492 RepID=UPI0008678020|nr:uncharacterized protein SAICODRAFT_28406 [Saitoella complicata NRRL Y-17804]ODQ56156.1 hypothetical protein SAICODRAFT_28406 [Saitoella complicata NRRL Y-17804]
MRELRPVERDMLDPVSNRLSPRARYIRSTRVLASLRSSPSVTRVLPPTSVTSHS